MVFQTEFDSRDNADDAKTAFGTTMGSQYRNKLVELPFK